MLSMPNDISKITETTYNGKIPTKSFMDLEAALFGVAYGTISLSFTIRAGRLEYTRLTKEITERADHE
jgi:hypothetical protein